MTKCTRGYAKFWRPADVERPRYAEGDHYLLACSPENVGWRRTHSQLVFQAIQAVLAVASGFDPKASFWDRRAIGKAAGWLP